MIQTFFPKNDDVIFIDDIQNKMNIYSDDYYICDGKYELVNKNINWKET